MTPETKRPFGHNEKAGYMSQLQEWVDNEVYYPMYEAIVESYCCDDSPEQIRKTDALMDTTRTEVVKRIQAKVLESYRNGQNALVQKPYQAPEKPSNRPPMRKAFSQKGSRGYVASKR